ncbi:MAG: enoyl-CoA hydratase/isomerase family protein [Planctomycetes bacterium]|nr:enoyl-CoA hydratase/isomerase family protein [Planctomycetota bacterium]
MDYRTLAVARRDDGIADVALARPERHNAFDDTVIAELTHAFDTLGDDASVRAILLRGEGKSFSAGADIEWMRMQGEADEAANIASALRMERAFRAIYACKRPVVARIHGAALGGGTGLTAAADIAITAASTTFGFTEVRLGILPAVISPYVIEKIGLAKAKSLFLMGSRFDGREAERIGLVFRAVPDDELDSEVEATLSHLAKGGPDALARVKRLCSDVGLGAPSDESVIRVTTEAIAAVRSTSEAREGLAAFLEKRKPSWIRTAEDR